MFETAGLDPVFWMHHANVDRLWETYARDIKHGYPFADGTPAGPAKDSWSNQPFQFLRPDGKVFTWKAPMVTDIAKLNYSYESIKAPKLFAPLTNPPGQDRDPFGLDVVAPEPVAAAINVAVADTTDVELIGGDQGGGGAGLAGSGQRWTLRFDGLRAARPAITSYEVYLGLPSGASADPGDASHFVGVLSLFGVFESSADNGKGPGTGQTRVFEVTGVVAGLGAGFNPLQAALRLVPLNPDRGLDEVELTVGRISLDVG